MRPTTPPQYLFGYPAALVDEVQRLVEARRFAPALRRRYPQAHALRSDKALYDYVQALRSSHLRNAAPIGAVLYDSRLQPVEQALGMHTRSARVQGAKLKSRREIRIAAVFRSAPPEFLRMIVVHELAHLKEREHDKAFYQLCRNIEPDYAQYEFDLRAYLYYLDCGGEPLWTLPADVAVV